MIQFDPGMVSAMRGALEDVCRHLPQHSAANSLRAFVASKILQSARDGEKTYSGLARAGRSAIAEAAGPRQHQPPRIEKPRKRPWRSRRRGKAES